MSPKAESTLGDLIGHASRTIAEMVRVRGGKASNVRETGHWAYKTLEEAAEAAVKGDRLAYKALKIVKHAKRLVLCHS
jgi:hypothetical protein